MAILFVLMLLVVAYWLTASWGYPRTQKKPPPAGADGGVRRGGLSQVSDRPLASLDRVDRA